VLARCPPSDELHLAFTSYFARQLGVMSEIANHKSVQPIQKFMAAEWPNIEQAWRSALLRRDDASLVLLAESLMFQQSQLYAHYDIGALFIGTEQQLRGDAQLAPSLRALLLAGTARCLWNKLNQVPALDFARRGLQAAVASRQRAATYCSLGVMFEVYLLQNKLQEVEAIDHRLERTFSGAGEEIYRMRLFILRSMLKRALGDYAAALQLIDKTIAELQRFEWFDVIPLVMLDKCVVFEEAGDEQRSMQALEAAWLASELGSSRQIQVFILANLVNANPAALQNPSGLSYLDRANTIAANCILSSHIRLMLLLANAVFESRQRRLKSAGERFIQLLAAVTRQEALPMNASIFMAVVIWFRAVDDREACVTVLRHVEASADKVSRRSEAQKELAEFGEAPASGDELAPEVPPIAHVKMAEFALPRVREGLKQLAVR
jgi:hypothetical protein